MLYESTNKNILDFPVLLGITQYAFSENTHPIVVSTDKEICKLEENIKITIKNNSRKIIFSHV